MKEKEENLLQYQWHQQCRNEEGENVKWQRNSMISNSYNVAMKIMAIEMRNNLRKTMSRKEKKRKEACERERNNISKESLENEKKMLSISSINMKADISLYGESGVMAKMSASGVMA
jgi:hypothetical protein